MRDRPPLGPLKNLRRRQPTRPARPASARSQRCSPMPAESSRAERCSAPIAALEQADRRALHRLRVRLGALDLFVPALLKPAAQRWRAALIAVAPASQCRASPSGAATWRRGRSARRRTRLSPARPDLAPDRPCRPACEPCPKVRSAGGKSRLTPNWRPRSARRGNDRAADDRDRLRQAGDAWSWRGRRAARAPEARAAQPCLRRAGQAQALSTCGSTASSTASGWSKSRTLAQALIDTGHVRIDGKRVEKSERRGPRRQRHCAPAAWRVRVLGCFRCPPRRGPAARSTRLLSKSWAIDERSAADS